MQTENKNYISLIIWIVTLVGIGAIIGSLTKPEMSNWYISLNRAPLTPPNYVFPVAWTILYGMIGTCGWVIWCQKTTSKIKVLKKLYVFQLILNWSWTPLFFYYHLIGLSLVVLGAIDILVGMIIWLAYRNTRAVSLLLLPYLLWILFATYLNFYISWYN